FLDVGGGEAGESGTGANSPLQVESSLIGRRLPSGSIRCFIASLLARRGYTSRTPLLTALYMGTRVGDKHLCVAVKVVDNDAFILTAYLVAHRRTPMKKILGLSVVLAVAPFAQAADIEAGKARATTVCAACHGANGQSVSDTIPNLAAQRAGYIEAQ